MTLSLDGQTALVTGASRGIGRAIAEALAGAGARVGCVATTRAGLEPTLAALGGRGEGFAADLGDAGSIETLLEEIAERGLDVDILVNNAGITRDNLLLRLPQEDFERVLDVNLRAPFLLSKAFARPMMKKRSGRIINIASVVGLTGNAGQANYAASKAGLVGFTKSLARELAGRGVTCNVVAPGLIDTDMTKDIPEVNRKQLEARIPLSRLGSAAEVAEAVLFLAGPGASYITGQVLSVDGGMFM